MTTKLIETVGSLTIRQTDRRGVMAFIVLDADGNLRVQAASLKLAREEAAKLAAAK